MRLQRLIAVLVVAAAGVPGSGAAGESARVALLPIAVHSADSEPGYLSAGLAEMLASRLEQDGGISVIRLDSDAVATNSRVALDLGRPSGADFVLYGSFTQLGEGASLDVRVLPTNGSRPEGERRIFIQSGTVAEIIPQLSVLAEKVKRYVKNDESPEPVPASVSVGPSPRRSTPTTKACFAGSTPSRSPSTNESPKKPSRRRPRTKRWPRPTPTRSTRACRCARLRAAPVSRRPAIGTGRCSSVG